MEILSSCLSDPRCTIFVVFVVLYHCTSSLLISPLKVQLSSTVPSPTHRVTLSGSLITAVDTYIQLVTVSYSYVFSQFKIITYC